MIQIHQGVDIVEIPRFKKVFLRNEDFVSDIFTDREREYCLSTKKPYIHFAGRFAAKEAALKALGAGIRAGIDHITEWKPAESIKGIKNVAMSEDFLEFHFPGNPIMPGVLLLETLTQLTGWLEAASSDFKNWFLINKVRKCNFYGFALPGDRVELEVQIISNEKSDTKKYSGTGLVNGRRKITAEFEGKLMSLSEIEDPEEQKRFFQLLTRGLKL